jgi:Ni/Fe-hydrogenase subunit HybB-like protein
MMVVVPTSHDVTLQYANTASDNVAELISLAALAAVVALFIAGWRAKRSRRARSYDPGS